MNDTIPGGCFQVMKRNPKTHKPEHSHYVNAAGNKLTDNDLLLIPKDIARARGIILPKPVKPTRQIKETK